MYTPPAAAAAEFAWQGKVIRTTLEFRIFAVGKILRARKEKPPHE
jgi:hypothetical protein